MCKNNIVTVSVECVSCGKVYHIDMTQEQYDRLLERKECIQDILPEVEPGIRELVISGICPECWNNMFKEE